MQCTNTNVEQTNPYTVGYWREQFQKIRPRLERNWHQQLAKYEPSLDSLKGATDMRAVSHGKASLVITQRIVSIAERMLDERPKKRRTTKTPMERARLGFS